MTTGSRAGQCQGFHRRPEILARTGDRLRVYPRPGVQVSVEVFSKYPVLFGLKNIVARPDHQYLHALPDHIEETLKYGYGKPRSELTLLNLSAGPSAHCELVWSK
mmetsp:Transcript_8596/g.13940  ORF Transcript_8596/g.13940 Transcript_8596/m.13940 type:complete len:105 (-) Transcript_8596:255-569(-)